MYGLSLTFGVQGFGFELVGGHGLCAGLGTLEVYRGRCSVPVIGIGATKAALLILENFCECCLIFFASAAAFLGMGHAWVHLGPRSGYGRNALC